MTAPVQPKSQVTQAQATSPVQGKAPGGVGSAPTTLQGRPQAEEGYFARFAIAIRNFIVMIFSMIFSCCRKSEPTSAEKTEPQPDLRAQHQDTLNRLKNTLLGDELLQCFYSNTSEAEREPIFLRLGQSVPERSWFAENRAQTIQKGKAMVEREPALIIHYLIQKFETLAKLK